MMFCSKHVLVRALGNYQKYQPTASEHLQQCRAQWIPVHVRKAFDKQRVRMCAERVLRGWPYLSNYNELREEHRLAVALVAIQGWAEHLSGILPEYLALRQKNPRGMLTQIKEESTRILTDNLFKFLDGIELDYATLAVRNWSKSRDGGVVEWFDLFRAFNLSRVPSLMQVYIKIRNKWDQVGYDWDRRVREEAALVGRTQ